MLVKRLGGCVIAADALLTIRLMPATIFHAGSW